MKNNIIIIIALFYSLINYAQQDSHYTQYMYNMSIINPAYMINEPGLFQVGSLYRTQWVSVTGAPKTANVFAHIPINNQIEFNVNYINDKIGSNINVATNVFNIDLAYKIDLDETKKLSFGVKTGLDSFALDASNSNVASDPLFQENNTTNFTMGAGVFLFADNYYVGLSVPNLIPSKIEVDNSGSLKKSVAHYYLTGGYVFDVSDSFKVKPSAILKEVTGVPLSFDVSMNVLYNNRFELGVSYRYDESISGLVAINITPSLRIGYAYDYIQNDLKNYSDGSHEFILLYKFDLLSLSKKYSSPRFY